MSSMPRLCLVALLLALLADAAAAFRRVIFVRPGQSIQAALDRAPDGAAVYVLPGDYAEDENALYGLRVSKNNVRLIGFRRRGKVVRVVPSGDQRVGVYAAPEGCGYEDMECDGELKGFTIKGIVVEGFPENGIQTRWVDGFKFVDSESIDNLKNGIYPTLSKNGLIKGCTAKGSLDAGLWVAGSRSVKVIDNEVSDSVTGIEVTVSKDVYIARNRAHGNVVGIGMYHANMAGTTPDFPPYDNWVFEHNHIFDNNRVNDAPLDTFQGGIPSGVGVLMVGIRGQIVRTNLIEGHDSLGFAMIGFCEVQQLVYGVECIGDDAPRDNDPSANDNQVVDNKFVGNGANGLPALGLPGVDILYLQTEASFLGGQDANCFDGNVGPDGGLATSFATDLASPSIPLPAAGCA